MQSGRQAKPRLEASQEVHPFMALYKAHSAAEYGIDAHLIDVEVDLYPSGTARDFTIARQRGIRLNMSKNRDVPCR